MTRYLHLTRAVEFDLDKAHSNPFVFTGHLLSLYKIYIFIYLSEVIS